ncbi:MAG: dienelactone hydrolase family protein, partial [Planctomycetota bacterium]
MKHAAALLGSSVALLALALSPATVQADLVEEEVKYLLADGTPALGFLVYDDDFDGDRPGVLVIPEWWGLNDYPKMRARELAEEGAIAFVADMYGNGTTTREPAEANKLSKKAGETGLAVLAKPALDQL